MNGILDVKKEFISMYMQLCNKQFIEHNLFAMGNFAVFVDYYFQRKEGKKIFKQLRAYLKEGNKNDFLFIVAMEVYYIAKKYGLGENLDFRLKRVRELHAKKKLYHFDILLDEYDYPSWFKEYIPYIKCENSSLFYLLIFEQMKKHPELLKEVVEKIELAKLKFYIDCMFDLPERFNQIMDFVDVIHEKNVPKLLSMVDNADFQKKQNGFISKVNL